MADLLHIFISPKDGVSLPSVEEKLSLALDWFRYAEGCYLVYTSKSIQTWDERLGGFVRPGGHLFIIGVDPVSYKGFMPKSLWPWLKDKRDRIYGDEE